MYGGLKTKIVFISLLMLTLFMIDVGSQPVKPPIGNILSGVLSKPYTCRNDRLTIENNLSIVDGGALYLAYCMVSLEGGSHSWLNVSGGILNISNSVLMVSRGRYSIYVRYDGQFRSYNSIYRGFGWRYSEYKDELLDQYLFFDPGYTDDKSRGGHGIEVESRVDTFINNLVEDIGSIRFYGDGNVVIGNKILNIHHEGLAFFGSNNIIINNTISNASRMDREIHGLRFYPGSNNNTIRNNSLRNLPIGISISNIPPWTKNRDYLISDNLFEDFILGINVLGEDIVIEGNVFRHFLSRAIFLNDCRDVVVKNNQIYNATLWIDRIYSDEYWDEVKHLFPNREWFYFSVVLRGGILIGWSGSNISILDNIFKYIPIYGYGIAFDVKYIARDVKIYGNTFEHIVDGLYLDEPGYVINTRLYSVPLADLPRGSGAAIELESTNDVEIAGNKFLNVLNGISTSFPDAIGNYGNLSIVNNIFIAPDPEIWTDLYSKGLVPIVGIGIGTSAFHPEENEIRYGVYNGRANIDIVNNSIINYIYPIVIDNRDPDKKIFNIFNNNISDFYQAILDDAQHLDGNIFTNDLKPNLYVKNVSVEHTSKSDYIVYLEIGIENLQLYGWIDYRAYVEIYLNDVLMDRVGIDTDRSIYNYSLELSPGSHRLEVRIILEGVLERDLEDNIEVVDINVEETVSTDTGVGGGNESRIPEEEGAPSLNPYLILIFVLIIGIAAIYPFIVRWRRS